MNAHEYLVGQHFTRDGVRYTVVKCVGATVYAACLRNNRVRSVPMPLAEVLDRLEVIEIDMTTPVVADETG